MEDRIVKITQSEKQKRERIFLNEESLKDVWDNSKHSNIHIMKVPAGEEREKGTENLFEEIMAENALIWGRK